MARALPQLSTEGCTQARLGTRRKMEKKSFRIELPKIAIQRSYKIVAMLNELEGRSAKESATVNWALRFIAVGNKQAPSHR
jgi:hypothetical protein